MFIVTGCSFTDSDFINKKSNALIKSNTVSTQSIETVIPIEFNGPFFRKLRSVGPFKRYLGKGKHRFYYQDHYTFFVSCKIDSVDVSRELLRLIWHVDSDIGVVSKVSKNIYAHQYESMIGKNLKVMIFPYKGTHGDSEGRWEGIIKVCLFDAKRKKAAASFFIKSDGTIHPTGDSRWFSKVLTSNISQGNNYIIFKYSGFPNGITVSFDLKETAIRNASIDRGNDDIDDYIVKMPTGDLTISF